MGTSWDLMETTRGPLWDVTSRSLGEVTNWGPLGDDMGRHGDHMETTWGPFAHHLRTTWGQLRDLLGTTWRPLGDH